VTVTLHETGGPDGYRNVLARIHRALQPGGTLLGVELPYPDSPEAYRTKRDYRLLARVQLHEASSAAAPSPRPSTPEASRSSPHARRPNGGHVGGSSPRSARRAGP
jgi:hypothetical protein